MRRLVVILSLLFCCWAAGAQEPIEDETPTPAAKPAQATAPTSNPPATAPTAPATTTPTTTTPTTTAPSTTPTATTPAATAPASIPIEQVTVKSPPASAQSTAKPAAQQTGTFWVPAPEERWWFPQGNWIYGFAQFDIAPPHNEPDPNFCAANAGDYGGANSQCNLFARYLIWGQVTVRPFGKTALRRIKIFWNPTFVFGNNVPQFKYTWSMQGIGWERQWGGDIYLGRRFDLRLTQQNLFERFSSRPLGPAYLGPNGPWGRFFTIGVRKSFGNPRVIDEGAQ